MENPKSKQSDRVMDHMRDFGSITACQAMQDPGEMRLASRVSELRKDGHPITSSMVPVKNRYGETCHSKECKLGGDAP